MSTARDERQACGGDGDARFRSVLVAGDAGSPEASAAPAFFGDLNLDQVLAALVQGRAEYDLGPFFRAPLRDAGDVRYRQQACAELERQDVRATVDLFAGRMESSRRRVALVAQLRHPLERQGWLLEAMREYRAAVEGLDAGLGELSLGSKAFQGLRRHLAEYTASAAFTRLAAGTDAVTEALTTVRYTVLIHGPAVTVDAPQDEPDLGAEVLETFARFRRGEVSVSVDEPGDSPQMNHVEARIAELVADQQPAPFRMLAEHVERHEDFLDPVIHRFHREAQFLLAYLDVIRPLRDAGLAFSYPDVAAGSRELDVEGAFDLALALSLAPSGGTVVPNDIRLEGPERVLVVSGPNNGGKTTLARAFGQLHHLAALGLPVPGGRARIPLADGIFTHFERVEAIENLRGRLDDELVRVHAILEQATPASVIVMNESFGSTTLEDARAVGRAVLGRIQAVGAACVYVTFVEELAELSDATVSMVSQVDPDDPATRTFRVVRAPADGLAYASAIAAKHGLTYERLIAGIGR